ncbi:MAG: translation initiation factor eIF-2B [Halobacteriales archaeon]|nr:translation initiation factor eIF-2B [Halobacteriales archaeon]
MIDETVAEIREMRTHSSSVVAVKAARALGSLADREFATVEEFERSLTRNSSALRRAAPSHASLWSTQRELREAIGEPGSVEEGKARLEAAVESVVERVEAAKTEAAANAADELADGETVFTHDYSTTVLAALEAATATGKRFDVYVSEARPRHLGRKTARELGRRDGVEPTLVVDSAMGVHLPECDRVLVGMDCIVGDRLYNRVGTYPLAATADDLGVPVWVVGSDAKRIDTGFEFENEYRAESEVVREPPEGFAVSNPAYDATPLRLLDGLITDAGVERL